MKSINNGNKLFQWCRRVVKASCIDLSKHYHTSRNPVDSKLSIAFNNVGRSNIRELIKRRMRNDLK